MLSVTMAKLEQARDREGNELPMTDVAVEVEIVQIVPGMCQLSVDGIRQPSPIFADFGNAIHRCVERYGLNCILVFAKIAWDADNGASTVVSPVRISGEWYQTVRLHDINLRQVEEL